MGRPATFDSITIVQRARGVFWTQGYESTSLPDLEQATGLSRSSLYHAFGSKRGLFDATVSSYLNEVIEPLLGPLIADKVEPEANEIYLTRLRASLSSPGQIPGCLLLRAAASPIGQDPAITAIISGYRSDLTRALSRGAAARHPSIEPDGVAHLAGILTALVVTAMTLSPIDRAAAISAIDTARGVNAGGIDAD